MKKTIFFSRLYFLNNDKHYVCNTQHEEKKHQKTKIEIQNANITKINIQIFIMFVYLL